MGDTGDSGRCQGGAVARRAGCGLASVACFVGLLGLPVPATAACVLTFRHLEVVRADRCEGQGDILAYARCGGWIAVPESLLASVEDAAGVLSFFPPFAAEENRARLVMVPMEGGAPVALPPAAMGTSLPPRVEYVPVPVAVSVPAQAAAQAPWVTGVGRTPAFCLHCIAAPRGRRGAPHAGVVPVSPWEIGPYAIQKSFPPISPLR